MAGDFLTILARANLALAAAVLLVLILRRPVRGLFGARAAYALWLMAPLATVAALLPARTVIIRASAPSVPAVSTLAPITDGPSPSLAAWPSPPSRVSSLLDLDVTLVAIWG